MITAAGPELELMFRLAESRHSSAGVSRIRGIVANGVDWKSFLSSVERHAVAPVIDRSLRVLNLDDIPSKVSETLRVRTRITTWKTERFATEIVRLNRRFAEEGIPVINYKGAAAAWRLYGDVLLRTYNDVDFLVRRADLAPALAVLESEGYRNAQRQEITDLAAYLDDFKEFLYMKGDIRIEPHWSITARRYPFRLDYEAFWQRSTLAHLPQGALPVLALEDELHVLCLVAAKGWWKRFQMVTDIARCMSCHPKLDYGSVLRSARAAGSHRIVLLGMLLAHELQEEPLPDQVVASIQADRAVLPIARRIVASFAGSGPENRWLPSGAHIVRRDLLAMREAPGDKLKYLWRTTTTPLPSHRARFPLPGGLRWLYTLLVPLHDYLAYPILRATRRRSGP